MTKLEEILKSRQFPGVIGTRDSFGIGKEFVDKESGKLIDTWPKWQKAGYRDFKDTVYKDKRDPDMKERVKEQIKIKKRKLSKGEIR